MRHVQEVQLAQATTQGATQPTRSAQRLSVNLSHDVAEALQWIAEKHGSTITDAVRRWISTQKYMEEALDKNAKILIAEEGQPVRELVFI